MGSRLLKDFEITKKLGIGGFGLVVECLNLVDKNSYAVKTLQVDEYGHREIQNLVKIPYHSNLVQYITCWKDTFLQPDLDKVITKLKLNNEEAKRFRLPGGSIYLELLCIQMELCNKDLRHWLNEPEQKIIEIDTAKNVFLQICNGLEHIHSQNIIHRDLKPENIFFGFGVGIYKVKIGDLGLGAVHSVGRSAFHTKGAGTPYYLAPEQGRDKYGKSVDIYALGIIFMELLCPELQQSFNKNSWDKFDEALTNLKYERTLPSSLYKKDLPVEKLILEMTSVYSEKRPNFSQIYEVVQTKTKENNVEQNVLRMARLVEDFSIKRILGTGGFGLVLECQNLLDKNTYAIKTMELDKYGEREIENLVKLPNHKNLVQYITCWKDKLAQKDFDDLKAQFKFTEDENRRFSLPNGSLFVELLCIQMELCSNDLRKYLNSQRTAATGSFDALYFFRQITNGLEHIHKHKMIHRDLKPENVFISKNDSTIVKIGDLGLGASHNFTKSTYHTKGAGTTWYLAPEQGRDKYGPPVDIYALGILFMELLCPNLQPKFHNGQWDDLSDAINSLKYEKNLPESLTKCNPNFGKLILKMTSTNSKNRATFVDIYSVIVNDDEKTRNANVLKVQNLLKEFTFNDKVNEEHEIMVQRMKDNNRFKSSKVEQCLLKVDRGNYVKRNPYSDSPQGIGCFVNISAPHMHAMMLEAVAEKLHKGGRALDIGSGSGYITVCMALLVGPSGKVIGIEHMTDLADISLNNIEKDKPILLKHGTVSIVVGDGRKGYEEGAQYDVIHIGAASETLPEKIFEQIKEGGRIVAPIGLPENQKLQVIDKINGKKVIKDICGVRFALLTSQTQQLTK